MCCHGSGHTHGYLESLPSVLIIPSFISDIPALKLCIPNHSKSFYNSEYHPQDCFIRGVGFSSGESIPENKCLLFPNSWQNHIPAKWGFPWAPKSGNQESTFVWVPLCWTSRAPPALKSILPCTSFTATLVKNRDFLGSEYSNPSRNQDPHKEGILLKPSSHPPFVSLFFCILYLTFLSAL